MRTVTDTHFGVSVPDPYRYLEDMKNPDVAAWVKAQAEFTRATLDRVPGRAALVKRIGELGDAVPARVSGVQVNGAHYYYLKRLATENIPRLYVRAGLNGNERLLVDPQAATSARGGHFAIDYYAPSFDNKYVAYGISPGGSEESVLRVIEVATGKETGEAIDRAQFGPPSWTDDNRLLYNRLPKLAPDAPRSDKYLRSRAYIHTIGSDPERDRAILGHGVVPDMTLDPLATPFVFAVPGAPWVIGIVGNGNQREFALQVAPAASLANGVPAWRRVAGLDDEVTDAALIGSTLYLLTHRNAPHFKVLRVDLANPDLATASVAVPASDAVITGIAAGKDALYVRRMIAGVSDLLRVAHTPGAKPVPVKLPFAGDIDALAADPRQPGVVFSTGSWTRFGGYFAYDPTAGGIVDTKLQPQGRYDNPGDLVATEVKVKSHDGTLVPLSIVHRKDLKPDGTNPAILYGYGAYGISQTPSFRPQYLAWFERGGVFAVAHVRGGGENGEQWYKGGYQQTKPNTWRDAIACAEWLVAQRVHVTGAAGDPGRKPGWHPRRAVDHRAARPVRRRDRAGSGIRCLAVLVRVQRRARHDRNGHRRDGDGIPGAPRDEPLPPHPRRREIPGSAGHHRHQRSARGSMAGREDGGTAAGRDGERQTRAVARRLRRRPWLRLDQEAAQRGARRHARVSAVAVRREGPRAVGARIAARPALHFRMTISTRRASALSPEPCVSSGFAISILSSPTPADFS